MRHDMNCATRVLSKEHQRVVEQAQPDAEGPNQGATAPGQNPNSGQRALMNLLVSPMESIVIQFK